MAMGTPDTTVEVKSGVPAAQAAVRCNACAPLIVIADPDGRNIYASAAVRAYTGLSGEALKGDGWLDVLHPDDQTRAAEAWTRAATIGGRYEADYRYRRHDGAYRWFHVKAICDRDSSGRICRWFIVSEAIEGEVPGQ